MFAELHQDLKAHLNGHTLEHPLVQWPDAYPAYYARLNRCYEFKLAIQDGTHVPNEWDLFHPELDLMGRMHKYFEESFNEDIDDEDYLSPERLSFFGQCWTSPEVIAHTSDLCSMMTEPHGFHDISAVMTPREEDRWHALPGNIEIYRGHGVGTLEGCCWYSEREIAAAWASIPNYGFLSSGRIARQHVRAVFDRRGEIEFIVRSRAITDLKTIEYKTVARATPEID